MRGLRALALLLVGALSGIAAVALHGRWWGFALATVAVLATLAALGPGWSTRVPFALGFGLVVLRLAVSRPEGDFLIAGDTRGYLVMVLSLVVAAVAVGTLPRPGAGVAPGASAPNPRMAGDED